MVMPQPARLDDLYAGWQGMAAAADQLAGAHLRFDMLTRLLRDLDKLAAEINARRLVAVRDAYTANECNAARTARVLRISTSRVHQLLAAEAKAARDAT